MSKIQTLVIIAVLVPALALAGCKKPASEQQATALKTVYNPRETFAPLTLPVPVNSYRSGDGTPGPDYWQNRADYKIAATLDPANADLSGDETITYTNNSPSVLDALWVQLDENIYKKDARARFVAGEGRRRRSVAQVTEGFVLDAVEIGEGSQARKADFVVSDTRMQVRLPEPLKGHGGQLKLHIRYHYTVPEGSSGRTGHAPTKNGEIFDLAQWYPRMAVFDDLRGWDTLPYLSSRILSRIWRCRLRRHRAVGHAGGGLGRTGQSGRGSDRNGKSPHGCGAGQRQDRDDPHRGGNQRPA